MITVVFCMMVILSFFVDAEIPLYIYIIAGILSLDEIAVYLMGHLDSKRDRENRKVYKDYRRK